jgi:aspartyl protease family protein
LIVACLFALTVVSYRQLLASRLQAPPRRAVRVAQNLARPQPPPPVPPAQADASVPPVERPAPAASVSAREVRIVEIKPPPQPENAGERSAFTVKRNAAGSFVGIAQINKQNVKFLLDTGASLVVVPQALALRLGLKMGEPVTFKTAGGNVIHYATTLDSLRLGAIELRAVKAVINPVMQDDFALLGMSALKEMHIAQKDDALVLSREATAPPANPAPSDAPATPFKRSLKECMADGNRFDSKTLACLRGE